MGFKFIIHATTATVHIDFQNNDVIKIQSNLCRLLCKLKSAKQKKMQDTSTCEILKVKLVVKVMKEAV
jgi:hypothetical protein